VRRHDFVDPVLELIRRERTKQRSWWIGGVPPTGTTPAPAPGDTTPTDPRPIILYRDDRGRLVRVEAGLKPEQVVTVLQRGPDGRLEMVADTYPSGLTVETRLTYDERGRLIRVD